MVQFNYIEEDIYSKVYERTYTLNHMKRIYIPKVYEKYMNNTTFLGNIRFSCYPLFFDYLLYNRFCGLGSIFHHFG